MQALILAAGAGRRLGNCGKGNAKCLLPVNGRPLLQRALAAIADNGVRRVVIVTGYCESQIRGYVNANNPGLEVIYVRNESYAETNNIHSLWLARHHLAEDDTLLLEGDMVFDKELLSDLLAHPYPNVAAVAKHEPHMVGTVVVLDDDKIITRFVSKEQFDWGEADRYYKTVNIYKLSKEFCTRYYLPFLAAYVKSCGRSDYYERVLGVICALDNARLKAYVVDRSRWCEIDDIQDLDYAEVLFADSSEHLMQIQRRWGGYWRFPEKLDFCFTVNPLFPTNKMKEELARASRNVIGQYPSAAHVLSLLAARVFPCAPEEILVGNGASELIAAVLGTTSGRTAVILPTFNEYLARSGSKAVPIRVPASSDFAYDENILGSARESVSALVIVNPDNPTGHFLLRGQIVSLLQSVQKANAMLILDESFGDFAEEHLQYSMIDSETLKAFPHLIVLRSLGKSYGVPGLRLGVLATANKQVMERLRQLSPIWNINSLAEYFLQILGNYLTEYKEATRLVREERKRLAELLPSSGFLRVLPSQANYLLCEVVRGYTATELTSELLRKHNILVKDCSGKPGLENNQFVRIAVRSRAENDSLLQSLCELSSERSPCPAERP